MIAPKEVREEIRQGDDELVPWAKGRKTMFKAPDKEQLECVKEIEAIFPSLVDPSKQTPQADPFVVALAHCGTKAEVSSLFQRKRIVVTEERRTRPHGIPQVCAHYNIECISLMDLFRREGWKF